MKALRLLILSGIILFIVVEWLSFRGVAHRVVVPADAVQHDAGRAFIVPLPDASRHLIFRSEPDSMHSNSSTLELFEDGAMLGPAHASHQSIRDMGGGRFSFWNPSSPQLYFSSTDGTDPRTNGRLYQARVRMAIDPVIRDRARLLAGALLVGGVLPLLVMTAVRDRRGLRRPVTVAAICLLAAAPLAWALQGVPAVAAAALFVTAAAWFIGWTASALLVSDPKRPRHHAALTALSIGAPGFAAVVGELILAAASGSSGSMATGLRGEARASFIDGLVADFPIDRAKVVSALDRSDAISPDPRWAIRPHPEPWQEGAANAYDYYGAPHVVDARGVRLPFRDPPDGEDEDGRPVVLVIGDSLTWGQGVAVEDRWSAVLRRELEATRPVRVLNLAACGHQSEDSLRALRRGLEMCRPVAVIYGICHNDLLPSGESQASTVRHLPQALRSRSRLASLLDWGLVGAQLRLGLARDFYEDAVRGGQEWEARFERDLADMVAEIRACDAVPIAMVLDARPAIGGLGWTITSALEAIARRAGFDLIASDPYYQRFNGTPLHVSLWEGHPNEIAHAVWGRMFADRIRGGGPEVLRSP